MPTSESKDKETQSAGDYVSIVVNDIDDTTRIATGFVLGGITAVYFNFGIVPIILMGGGMVVLDALYVVFSVYNEAWKTHKQNRQED